MNEQISWSSLDIGLTLDDKFTIVEEFYSKGNLTESNDSHAKNYFIGLFNLSDTLIENENYIVVPLALVNNKIMKLDDPKYMTYLSRDTNTIKFNSSTGEKSYPSKTIRDIALYNTFTFSSEETYDKFRVMLVLKFDTRLINITILKTESKISVDQKL